MRNNGSCQEVHSQKVQGLLSKGARYLVILLSLFIANRAFGFTQVLISTAAPAGIEETFLANATAYLNAQIIKNPLAAHTYTLKIFGINQVYNPPPIPSAYFVVQIGTNTQTVYQSTASLSDIYAYAFGAGQSYERQHDLTILGNWTIDCSSGPLFGVSTSTWNQGVCTTAIMYAAQDIYQQNFSTPTVIPLPGSF